ncbi:hypothetical protein NUW58_g1904 [Xylaria curta]|uniref:Uncharacterized protein n=1 Tax=Xylaria curta TaxID=42375 RepID=A0ACC1PK43_9PEZI|nr:hypothetical protein NUW58_g1904 [Xylaria curta]
MASAKNRKQQKRSVGMTRLASIVRPLIIMLLTRILPTVRAQNTTLPGCVLESDSYVGNAQARFEFGSWISRGICIKQDESNAFCYDTLLGVLQHLNDIRAAEYSGAAGVLALLPTMGALLGAPTNEIWRILTIVPFGGALAMALSFGGAILPTRIEDYESAMGGTLHSLSSPRLRRRKDPLSDIEFSDFTKDVRGRLGGKLHGDESISVPKSNLWFGLISMFILWLGSQFAITVVEQGAVLPWYCVSRWWFHLWYILVTITAIVENWVQLPFSKQFKLYLSDVPYTIRVTGGEDITKGRVKSGKEEEEEEDEGKVIGRMLRQLKTVKAGVVEFIDSSIPTSPPKLYFGHGVVFVTGTAFFASAQLVALPMAVMALTLLLAAGIFSRGIVGYICNTAEHAEPMTHVMVNSLSEAHKVVAAIMKINHDTGENGGVFPRAVQIEVDGHIFVDCRRIATRSRLYTSLFGIMAGPFDLGSLQRKSSACRYGGLSTTAPTPVASPEGTSGEGGSLGSLPR